MRNKYAAPCYRCGETVKSGEGHFQRYAGKWLTQHAACAIKYRGTDHGLSDEDKATEAIIQENGKKKGHAKMIERTKARAKETGKRGNKARRRLRELGITQT